MSATSSTFSAVSGSTSASGIGGAANDLDNENVPAESEWSAPGGHDRRDGRRGNGSTSSRPWKTNGYQSGSRSARGSRGTSPHSFQYASIYDPPQAIPYEGTTAPGAPPPPGYMHYGYPYAPPQGQGPGQGYLAPYPPYYPQQYGYPAQPTHHSDPTTPAAPDLYPQHQMQPHMYPGGYMWPPMPAPPGHLSATSPPHHPGQPLPGHAPHAVTYSPTNYMQPHTGYGPYHPPHTGYYPPPSNGQMPPPLPPLQLSGQLVYPMDPSRSMNGSTHGGTPGHSRTSSRSSQGRRSAPPVRTAWSYGPGAAGGGFYGSDVVGPRLAGMRRMSGTSSVGSGSTGNRTPGGDDASSTVVSHALPHRELAH